MARSAKWTWTLVFVGVLVWGWTAAGQMTCLPDGMQASGSIYRICLPPANKYNHQLVIWCHGFQDAGTPVQIPEDQLTFGDVSIPDLITGLGFGFATNSYSKTGLAVRQAMDDVLDLVHIYSEQVGKPDKVYLTGASEGGLITTLLVEQHPDIFAGGLAACGPIGDFAFQIDYFGNGRVLFQYFFPGLIPGNPFNPNPDLVANWSSFYKDHVKPVILDPANRHKVDQLVWTAHLPYDPANYLNTVEHSIRDMLRYSVVNLKDATETLGGFPFENRRTWYSGSDNDWLLNWRVIRVAASPAAIAEMRAHYDTTGDLKRPLMTIHTRYDQQVPYFHERLYDLKCLAHGTLVTERLNWGIKRYGHCHFNADEGLAMLGLLLFYNGDLRDVNPNHVEQFVAVLH